MDPSPTLTALAELVAASPHNLVSRRDRALLHERHLPESRAVANRIPPGTHRLLDVGSGGGFPGLVIAIVRPEIEVHLLDSTQKKSAFLMDAAQRLGVDVEVHTGRAEELATGPLGGSFDVVTARAVAPLRGLLALTVPFLRIGGCLHAVKGARWRDEVADADSQLRRYNAVVVGVPTDDGPDSDPRVVIIQRMA